MSTVMIAQSVARAARVLREANAIVVAAGAGMGVDSGLPDFRGDRGLWTQQSLAGLGAGSLRLFSPSGWANEPHLAWGALVKVRRHFQAAMPHTGFGDLRVLCARAGVRSFVFTSNVDGHFQRAGFDPARIVECHGSMDFAQCSARCRPAVFPLVEPRLEESEPGTRARDPLPRCPACSAVARPNVVLFGDHRFDSTRVDEQRRRLLAFQDEIGRDPRLRLVVVECGAGTTIATVRHFTEDLVRGGRGTLVRVNPKEPDVPPGHVSVPLGAREGLAAIAAA
jgi:NAD-dependent SIR2 family protein deacetylase